MLTLGLGCGESGADHDESPVCTRSTDCSSDRLCIENQCRLKSSVTTCTNGMFGDDCNLECDGDSNVGCDNGERCTKAGVCEPKSIDGDAGITDSGSGTRARALGVKTYVISLSPSVTTGHLQNVANAGLGDGATNAEYWQAGDDQGLRTALSSIVGSAIDCKLKLNGTLNVASACNGSVKLNGTPLGCNDPDGWRRSTPAISNSPEQPAKR